MGGGWLFNRSDSTESCQLCFVRGLLLLPGHLWPPGVTRRRNTRHSSVQESSWWRSLFQALLPSGSHELQQLRNWGFVCLVSQRSISTCLASASYGKSYFSGTRALCIPEHSHRCHPQGSRIPRSHSCRRWSSWVPSGPGCRCCHSGCLRTQSHTLGFPQLSLCSLIKEMLGWTDASQSPRGIWEGNSSSFICLIKWKLGKCQRGEFCRCWWEPVQSSAPLKKLCMSSKRWRSGIALKSQNSSNNWSGNRQLIEAWLLTCCELDGHKKKNEDFAKTCSVFGFFNTSKLNSVLCSVPFLA